MKKTKEQFKVYLIAGCFPPFGRGNAITNMCVANGLAESFDVSVVCMQREEGGLISYQDDPSLVEGLGPNIHIERLKGANWFGINTLFYILGIFPCYFLNWAYNVVNERDRLFEKPGVVFAVYPVFSDLVIGYIISQKFGWPLLVDFRDDFSGVMSRSWRRIFRPLYKFLERKIILKASHVTVTTEGLKNDLLNRYGLVEEKISVVYNIVPKFSGKSRQIGAHQIIKQPLNILYAGAMSAVQRPEILLLANKYLCESESDWVDRVRIEFYGPMNPYFRMKVKSCLTKNCSFNGFVPQNVISDKLCETDIGFFSLSDSTYSYATPTKLFDYIETGVPIVASLPHGASRRIIEENKIGLVADVGDVEGLALQVKRMVENQNCRIEFRNNMKKIRTVFSTKSQIDKWKDVIVDLNNRD